MVKISRSVKMDMVSNCESFWDKMPTYWLLNMLNTQYLLSMQMIVLITYLYITTTDQNCHSM